MKAVILSLFTDLTMTEVGMYTVMLMRWRCHRLVTCLAASSGETYCSLVQGDEDEDVGPREDTAVEFLPAGEWFVSIHHFCFVK